MKKQYRHLSVLIFFCCIFLYSCDLDNYDAPNASMSGGILDVETNQLVRQDIVNGAQIEYIEHGFTNPETQFQIIKNDGTFQNNLMFSGTYTIHLKRGNFVPIDKMDMKVEGNTTINFIVQPYIRVKNVKIEKAGEKVIATFNIQQTVSNNVIKIGLYAHQQPIVGQSSNSALVEQNINGQTNENTLYTLELDLASNRGELKAGKQYYFIVGALIDAVEAKFNYAEPVRITV